MSKLLIIYVSNTPRIIDMDKMIKLKRISVNACNYNRQIMNGIIQNDCDVLALFDDINRNEPNKYTVHLENKINYMYFHVNNIYTKYKCLTHFIKLNKPDKILIISDTLNLRNVILMQIFAKLNQIKSIGIVTDLYRYFHIKGTYNIKSWLFVKLGNFIMKCFNAYMLISETMSKEYFVTNKPYFVSEGVFEPSTIFTSEIEKGPIKLAIYSGTITANYGILELMKAFNELKPINLKLHIYSSEPVYDDFSNELSNYIEFIGYLPRDLLLEKLSTADMLINPRPLYHEFNQFSFPSKLIEYMSTGIPTITTRIPSIPSDLINYLNYFESDDVKGLKIGIENMLLSDKKELYLKAEKAKAYVLENYTFINVAKKLIDLISF